MAANGHRVSSRPDTRPRARPEHGWHVLEWASELAGTAILVFVGLSAVVIDFGSGSPVASVVTSHSTRLLITGAVFAASGSLVAISPLGRCSGAHLNPSVTLAFFFNRHVWIGDLAGFVVSQCLGALCAAELLHLAWGARAASVTDGVTAPGRRVGAWGAVGIEAAMTALLVLVVFAFVSSHRTARFTPLAVWATVTVLVWQGASYTGTSLNTARSLGPAIVSGDFGGLWIYAVGPLSGALCAVLIWILVPRATLTAKLFHDERYRSVLSAELPVRH